ncbi:MAG: hypothetical protein K9K65_10470 [Desulfarculaceae bacterium]|nr:hypothetical protein [Desulfarculaceae bacterium]MCF8046792.1 hypothetical protein [Desulfarculaceae bacterium]MCF8066162.1 hypothetical protein [Desulfarculaceae bacterium]MCF8098255.1 hypothetical protein [Desulfarculaceae bacterium]MCF8123742.1 hypothetical protein [Desulfarculaceae bacterium]
MASDYDDLTVQYEEDGQVLVEQLDKQVLNKGLWTTVLFLYRERDKKTGEFGAPKAGFRRYQKVAGFFKKRDAINLSEKTTPQVMEKLTEWFKL